MQSGDRKELVQFLRLAIVPDEMGGRETEVWSDVGRAWAASEWVGGSEGPVLGKTAKSRVVTTTKYRFVILAAAAEELRLTAVDRVLWQGDLFEIREPPKASAKHRGHVEVYAETVQP